jgi:RHS repeat-associated protein
VRKVTENEAAANATPTRKQERYYLDGVEIYREWSGGAAPSLERISFDVMDDQQRVATIETEGETTLVRYQGTDVLSSAHIETDGTGRVISYEVYHPFGTTAYQAVDKQIAAAAKRYRYTGLERDEESGLEYHSARYYVPWLGRWTAPDHHAEQLDGNRYAYVRNNPIIHRDGNGLFEEPVHGMLTYRLALAAGFPKADAARLAIATAGMDHDKATMPGGPGDFAQLRGRDQTVKYHYPKGGFAEALGRVDANIAEQKDRHRKRQGDDIERFGQSLHTLEDIGFKEAPGPHMRTDPGKPATRILSATIGVVGLDVAVAAFGSMAHLLSSGAGADGKLFGGALLGLLGGFGIYMIIVAFYTRDLGHPSYKTERGEFSDSLHHTADQAPQDPVRNTAEMLRVYDKLKEYAHARYGRAAKANDKLAAGRDPAGRRGGQRLQGQQLRERASARRPRPARSRVQRDPVDAHEGRLGAREDGRHLAEGNGGLEVPPRRSGLPLTRLRTAHRGTHAQRLHPRPRHQRSHAPAPGRRACRGVGQGPCRR